MAGPITAWGDESIRTRDVDTPLYLLAACISGKDASDVQQSLGSIKPKHAKKLHWRDMRDSLKRKSIDRIHSMDDTHVIVVGTPLERMRPDRAREKCLQRLLFQLSQMNVSTLILESRAPSQDKRDVAALFHLQRSGACLGMRVEHLPGDKDARLWIPDQVLGAYGDQRTGKQDYAYFLDGLKIIEIEIN